MAQSPKAPCREACPAGVDVPRYIRSIKEGKFDRALAVIRESIPFPAACGYACVHPCESACARSQYEDPVAIRLLKRAAVEKGGDAWKKRIKPVKPSGKKVAVIGSGPCGLTAAYYLAAKGHKVDVFEEQAQAGGMLRYGIPGYRLPDHVVNSEIKIIAERGVNIETGIRVESADKLLERYHAVFAATGAWLGRRMGFEAESSPVLEGFAFLKNVNSGNPPAIGKKVLVVGGGNTAVDAARASVRLGAREVVVIYRRSASEMPASPQEVREAAEEGVRFQFLASPVRIHKKKLLCVKMTLGPADQSGRPRPVPLEGSEFSISFDTLITAVGQSADALSLGLGGNDNGTIVVGRDDLSTPVKGVFAGGDAVTGPSSIIEAIAQGKRAASSIDKFLGGSGNIKENLAPAAPAAPGKEAPRGTPRTRPGTVSLKDRKKSFSPVEIGLDDFTAVREAQRCLSCDLRSYEVKVNFMACKECGYCREVCGLKVFQPSESFNPSGYRPMVAASPERCMGCLRCFQVCPDFAINVEKSSGS